MKNKSRSLKGLLLPRKIGPENDDGNCFSAYKLMRWGTLAGVYPDNKKKIKEMAYILNIAKSNFISFSSIKNFYNTQ